jgi:hypothetical protein
MLTRYNGFNELNVFKFKFKIYIYILNNTSLPQRNLIYTTTHYPVISTK